MTAALWFIVGVAVGIVWTCNRLRG
jgi:hypothetical protein